MGLSDIYYKLEDGWYNFLDKLDEKIPVYNIIDPIDKVFPSFIVFIVIVLLLLGGIGFVLLGGNAPEPQGAVPVTILIQDADGKALSAIKAHFSYGEFSFDKTTDPDGKIALKLDLQTELTIAIDNAKYEKFAQTITISEDPFSYTAVLQLKGAPPISGEITRTIKLTDSQGRSLRGTNASISFSCSNSDVFPIPRTTTTTSGEVSVKQPANCGTLLASINVDGYDFVDSYPINDSTTIISLDEIGSNPGNNAVCGNNVCEFGESNSNCSLDCDVGDNPVPPVNPLKGTLEVTVRDSNGVLDGMKIKLLDNFSSIVDSEDSWAGYAAFYDIIPGTYKINVSDPNNRHIAETLSNVIIRAGETTAKSIMLAKTGQSGGNDGDDNPDDGGGVNDNKAHFITFDALDNASNSRIANASVRLLNNNFELVEEKSTGQFGSKLFFAVDANKTFNAIITADDYEDKEISGIKSDQNISARMNKLTIPRTTGNIKARVIDENGRKVERARIVLVDYDSNLSNWSAQFSDVNGETIFTGKSAGKYYAIATTTLAYGESIAKEVIVGQEIELPVNIKIGNTRINLTIIDNDDNPIPNAIVSVWKTLDDAPAGNIGTLTADADGKINEFIKAGRTIYFIASSQGFASTTTSNYTLAPNTTLPLTEIKLSKIIISQNPSVEFVGMFDGSTKVDFLEAGKTYSAKLKLIIPQSENFVRGGIHFRAGKDAELLENSPIIIKNAGGGASTSVVKSTTFTPPTGETTDGANLTNEDAKWVNIIWGTGTNESFTTGIYEATITVKIREGTPRATELQIYYRGWAEEASKVFRVPADNELLQAPSSAQKQALYANTSSLLFEEGTTPQPNDAGIGASEDDVLNTQTNLYESKPFNLDNAQNYVYKFSLFSLGDGVLDNALLDLRNVSGDRKLYPGISTAQSHLVLTGYQITTVGGNVLSAANLDAKEFTGLRIGRMQKGSRINGKLFFKTQLAGPTKIQIRITNAGRILYDELTSISVQAADSLKVETDISSLTAFAENNAKITIRNLQGEPIEGADIEFKIERDQDRQTIENLSGTTSINGTLNATIPNFGNDYNIIINAAKANFNAGTARLKAHTDIVDIVPQTFSSALNTISPRQIDSKLAFENKTGKIDLYISGINFSDTIDSVFTQLNKEKMLRYLDQWIKTPGNRGLEITATGDNKIKSEESFFRMVLNDSANKAGSFKGKMIITVASPQVAGSEWVQEPINFTANVTVGGATQAGCLTINQADWITSTSETADTSTEFTITNNCQSAVNGSDIELKDLQFKLEFEADGTTKKGDFKLVVEGVQADLRENAWNVSIPVVRNYPTTYNAVLTYSPNQGTQGQKVHAKIFVDAKNPADNSFVNNQAAKFDAQIDIVNLETCFKYNMKTANGATDVTDGRSFKILQTDSAIELEMENTCNSDFKIRLCNNESTADGSCGAANNTGLNPNPKEQTIKSMNSTNGGDKISFALNKPTIAGAYSINVEAKMSNRPTELFREIHRVRLEVDGKLFTDKPFSEVVVDDGNYVVGTIVLNNKDIGQEGPLATVPTPIYNWNGWTRIDVKPLSERDEFVERVKTAISQASFDVTGRTINTEASTDLTGNGIEFALAATLLVPKYIELTGENLIMEYPIALTPANNPGFWAGLGHTTGAPFKAVWHGMKFLKTHFWHAATNPYFLAALGIVLIARIFFWDEIFPPTNAYARYYAPELYKAQLNLEPEGEPTYLIPINGKQISSQLSLYDLTGDRYRRRYRGERHIWLQGNEDYGSTSDKTSLSLECPVNFILEDQADYSVQLPAPSIYLNVETKSQQYLNAETDNCWADGLVSVPEPQVNKYVAPQNWSGEYKQAVFGARCDGRKDRDSQINYDAYATCKYKNWKDSEGGETGKAKISLNIQNIEIKNQIKSGKPVYITLNVIGKDNVLNKYADASFGKIRIELKEKEKEQLPDRTADAALCETGVTGAEDLPKIGLSKGTGWNWNEISEDSCAEKKYSNGADNSDYIYCDATQFSISLLKRVDKVKEFLSDNGNTFSCPTNPLQSNETKFFAQDLDGNDQPINIEKTPAIPVGGFDFNRVSIIAGFNDRPNDNINTSVRTVIASITIQNNTTAIQSFGLKASLKNTAENYNADCIKEGWNGDLLKNDGRQITSPISVNWNSNGWPASDINVPFNPALFTKLNKNAFTPGNSNATEGLASITCLFENVKENALGNPYTLELSLKKIDSTKDGNASFSTRTFPPAKFNLIEVPPENAEGTFCDTPASTELVAGKFVPRSWLDRNDQDYWECGANGSQTCVTQLSVNWNSVKNFEELQRLTHFNAFLIDDSFSQDFIKDFDEYSRSTFANAPDWYINQSTGLGTIFTNPDNTWFDNQSNPNSSRIPGPGLYKVDIDVIFEKGNEWKFFSGTQPKALLVVHLFKLGTPRDAGDRDSIFYYLPFNGRTGLSGDSLSRQNYGVSYAGTKIKLNNSSNIAETFPDNASNALVKIQTEKNLDTAVLNSNLNTRGELLRIEDVDQLNKKMSFSPSIATPVLMKVSNDSLQAPFNVYYQFFENDAIVQPADNLTYWNGINTTASQTCRDYSGNYLRNAFSERSDYTASSEDGVPTNAYKLTWDSVNSKGNVWLTSVFYSSPDKRNQLSVFSPISKVKLITSNNSTGSQTASLNGVQGIDAVASIADVFKLVKNKQACISDNAQKAEFSWSNKAIIDAGLKSEIDKISPTAPEPYACIGS